MGTSTFLTIETYLRLLKEDPGSVPKEHQALFQTLEQVLKEYKSLDCITCGSHLGYQHRRDPNLKLCSSRCLSSLNQKLKPQGAVGLEDSNMHVETGPIPNTATSPEPKPEDSNYTVAEFIPSQVTSLCEVSKTHAEPEIHISQNPKLVPIAVDLQAKKSQEQDKKKVIWKLGDLSPSRTFVDGSVVYVSYKWDGGKVTVFAESDLRQITKLHYDIAVGISSGLARVINSRERMPEVNEIVLAPYTKGEYVRARVVKRKYRKLWVEFIDFGNHEFIGTKECFEPWNRLMMEHPIYGLTIMDEESFTLYPDGYVCLKRIKGEGTITAVLEQQILKKVQTANKSQKRSAVDSIPTTTKAEVEELSDRAPVSPAVDTPKIKSKESAPESSSNIAAPAPVLAPTPDIRRRPTNRFSGISKLKKTIYNSIVSPNIKDGAFVHIRFVWNDALVAISSVEDEADITSLDEAISAHVKMTPGLTSLPAIDDIVLAPYDGGYYRARVTSLKGDEVQVRFVDYGADAKGPYKDLKALNTDIAERPIYGTVFRMADVPDTKKISDAHPEIAEALESGGQIQLVGTGKEMPGEVTGVLWLSDTRAWNDIVLEIMDAQQEG